MKCIVKLIIDGDREFILRECDSYVEANKYKNFKIETDHRENVEYKIV